MRYGLETLTGLRITVTENLDGAVCPVCGTELLPKNGSINIEHWAHQANRTNCPGHKPMTQWHVDWQDKYPKECREVLITKDGETRIADVQLPDGTVIEFQHSPLPQLSWATHVPKSGRA